MVSGQGEFPSVSRRSTRRNKRQGLRGSALLSAIEQLAQRGVSSKEIWRKCGFTNNSIFQAAYSSALQSRNQRSLRLKSPNFRTISQADPARLRAQRKLANGEELTLEEFRLLPDYQQRALVRSQDPRARNAPNRRGRNAQMRILEATQSVHPPVRRSKLTESDLLSVVLDLERQGTSEINIAIKCGYNSEEIGRFRSELARAAGCKIAPMSKILVIVRSRQD